MSRLTSASGLLALLRETDADILNFALTRLNKGADQFWFEATADLALVEELHDSVSLPESTRQLASLLASKVYFHLGEYDESVHFALASGPLFEGGKARSLYIDTILSRCIDTYVQHRQGTTPLSESKVSMIPQLESLFTALAESWHAGDDQFLQIKELIGFMIRARRLDLLEVVLGKHVAATGSAEMLTFALHAANVLVQNYQFRRDILLTLSKMYSTSLKTVDYFSLSQCLVFLGDAKGMAAVLQQLLGDGNKIAAYQLAFDLFEFSNQEFIGAVLKALETSAGGPSSAIAAADAAAAPAPAPVDANLLSVMTGSVTMQLYTKFLYARCSADIHILTQTKKAIDPRNSVTHNATVLANALMYAGTTIDVFLRDNIEWLCKSQQWAKFTATASVGAIHKGQTGDALTILKPYLPTGKSVGPLPFQEAGALFALGLIHAPVGVSRSAEVIEYLKTALRTYGSSEQMIHGAALGLGLSAMGLRDEELFDQLFAVVSGCDAVAGEAAALAMGLIMAGSPNARMLEMLKTHACGYDQKEKTIRGISMAIALMFLGQEDNCLPLVAELLEHADPWVRIGGCFTLGLAYAGTSNAKAMEKLLEVAVRDVSDDVRRNAVTMIGFLTFKEPSLCYAVVRVLVDSYNPHIRYGVAMALAIAASGTNDKAIVEMLWTLKDDLVDFVRQGSFIALSMVLIQATDTQSPRVKELRALLAKKIADRKEDICTKFGCIIATGLLDGGGRNCTIALHRQRHRIDKAVVGMFIFTQHWYWFPYILMISLSMQPTCFIGLNERLEMPRYHFASNASPSEFAVPKSVQQEKKEAKAVAHKHVELSTTKKDQEYRDKKKRMGSVSTLDELEDSAKTAETAAAAKAAAVSAAVAQPAAAAPAEPAAFELLQNPARVTLAQFAVVSHDRDPRYVPVKASPMGVCVLQDRLPDQAADLVAAINPMDRNDDVKPPEPFAWP